MSLMDIFKKGGKFYMTKARCYNCGSTSELKVPKGQTIDEFISSGEAVCPMCKCATLKRIIVLGKVTVPSKAEQVVSAIKKEVNKIDRAMTPKPLPPKRRYEEEPEYDVQYQEVKHPVKKNQRVTDRPLPVPEPEYYDQEVPEFESPKPKKINLWTGKEIKE